MDKEDVENLQSIGSSNVKRKSKRKTSPAKSVSADNIGEGLAASLRSKSKTSVMASRWAAEFNAHAVNASVGLVNAVLELCGGSERLSAAQFVDGQSDEVLKALDGANFDNGDYAVHGRGKAAQTLRKRVAAFFGAVAVHVSKSALQNAQFDACIEWLTALASSVVRAYRHTATLAAVALMEALARLAAKDVKDLSTARRQSAAAKKRGASAKKRQTAGHVERLTARVQRFDELLSDLFDGVLVHRYRDSLAEVRSVCAEAFGALMAAHPGAFLADAYLKYLGWLLFDRDAGVRSASLTALTGVYNEHADSGKLVLFSQRFKARLLEMTNDKDDNVAAHAVAMCLQLAQMSDEVDVLEHDETLLLYRLTSDARPKVRAAAAAFANDYFLEHVVPANIEPDEDLQVAQIKGLVELVVEFTALPDNPAYLVDAMFGVAGALSCWSKMATLLEAPTNHDLEASDALPLARLLAAAARKATGCVIVPGGAALGAARFATKQRAEVLAARTTVGKALGAHLPKLLTRYAADAPIVAELASIVPCMALSHAAPRSSLKGLTQPLSNAFVRNVATDTLDELALAWRHGLQSEHTFKVDFEAAHASLAAQLSAGVVDTLRIALADDARDDALVNATAALTRLACFRQQVAPIDTDAELSDAIERALDAVTAPDAPPQTPQIAALAAAALKAYTALVMWQAKVAKDALNKSTPSKKPIAAPAPPSAAEDADEDADRDDKLEEAAAAAANEDDADDSPDAQLLVSALGVPRDSALAFVERLLSSPSSQTRQVAYSCGVTLGVLLCAQKPKTSLSSSMPAPLVAALKTHVSETLALDVDTFAQSDACADETADADADDSEPEMMLEALQAETLSAFCALVITNAVPMECTVHVYSFLLHASKRVRDLVRQFQRRVRQLDEKYEFEWLHRTLCASYELACAAESNNDEDDADDDVSDPPADRFKELHDLAKRFSQSYGISRAPRTLLRSLALLLTEGMGYATQPIVMDLMARDDHAAANGEEMPPPLTDAERKKQASRFTFLTYALEPFLCRLTPNAAARVLQIANATVQRAKLQEDDELHRAFFDFKQRLQAAAAGQKQRAAGTPRTASVKKSLKMPPRTASTKKRTSSAPSTRRKSARINAPQSQEESEDDEQIAKELENLTDDESEEEEEKEKEEGEEEEEETDVSPSRRGRKRAADEQEKEIENDEDLSERLERDAQRVSKRLMSLGTNSQSQGGNESARKSSRASLIVPRTRRSSRRSQK